MTFSATATIQSIEKLNDKFFKVLLEDEKGNHILINIPVSKEQELALNTKIDIWGNVSAFQYQNKWYNNLFAQTVVHALFHRHRILTQVSGDHVEVIKLIPPLIIGEPEVDRFMTAFIEVMDDAHSGSGLMWDFGKSLLKQSRSAAD